VNVVDDAAEQVVGSGPQSMGESGSDSWFRGQWHTDHLEHRSRFERHGNRMVPAAPAPSCSDGNVRIETRSSCSSPAQAPVCRLSTTRLLSNSHVPAPPLPAPGQPCAGSASSMVRPTSWPVGTPHGVELDASLLCVT
jgi:hypothetical protein